jgi:hypothetical protein
MSIYVQRAAGRWEAFYWHTDEQRYFRFSHFERARAISKAAKHGGYNLWQCTIVPC